MKPTSRLLLLFHRNKHEQDESSSYKQARCCSCSLQQYSGTSFYFDPLSSFIWRFPIAFQIAPLLVLVGVVWLMPESPRWLIKVGREEEGRYVLGRLRGETGEDMGKAEAEFQDIRNVVELERKTSNQQSYFAMFTGIGSGKLHTARRVHLVVWLQILQEWIGIAGITLYGPTIFTLAGISAKDRLWVSGLNDITYMVRSFPPRTVQRCTNNRSSPRFSAFSHSIVSVAAGPSTGAL